MEENRQQYVQEDTISVKALILKLRDWRKYLLSKWLIIVVCGIAGGAVGLICSLMGNTDYEAELTFIVEDSKSNPLSAYAGLASQFGIDLGSGSNSGVFEGDNVIEFLKSRLMIEQALLSPITINGERMSLAELYIKTYKMRDKWKKRPALQSISFPATKDRTTFSLQQDSILKVIQEQIGKKKLTIEKIDKKLSFIRVRCTSRNELFSKAFTDCIVGEAIKFYIDTKTQRNKINITRLQAQADSIEILLNRKTFSAAAIQDLNLNPARQAAGVGSEVAMRDKFMLQTMYAEVIKNLELSKIAMAQETPVIQVVDKPILPLKENKLGKVKGIVIGIILSGILIVCLLLGKKIFGEIMAED